MRMMLPGLVRSAQVPRAALGRDAAIGQRRNYPPTGPQRYKRVTLIHEPQCTPPRALCTTPRALCTPPRNLCSSRPLPTFVRKTIPTTPL
uniref:Secreted protein n=1 Tax=Knipowitschia caucasica TaxID=637954 RepID=A0AAV2KP73_KNICA